MAYEVLARKYRPQTFAEVIAQEHVTTTLANSLKSGRISSGYLFCGPRGTGKTSVARILARSINCDRGPTVTPCGTCDSCRSIGTEASIDVREIDAASNTSVDDIRTLRENVRYGPSSAQKKRIYIIDEVHRLSGSAFDALLKTLEEPPAHVMFIFATTEPQKVPDTIHSRTQRYDFRRVASSDLIEPLRKIASQEGFQVSDEALRIIARRGEGSVRDSISLLDQLMSFSDGEVTAELVINALGMVEAAFYFRFVEALAASDAAQALEMIAGLVNQGADLKDFALELAEHFRSLTILKSTSPEQAEKILDLTGEEMARFATQVDYFTIGDLVRLAEILTQALLDLKDIDPRWTMEIAAIKMAHLESTIRIEEALSYIESAPAETDAPHRERSDSAGPQRAVSQSADLFNSDRDASGAARSVKKNETEIRTPPPRPEDSAGRSGAASQSAGLTANINHPKVISAWPEFLAKMKSSSLMLASQLSMATVTEVKENRIHAVFPASGAANAALLERPTYRRQVEAALRDFFDAPLAIEFEIADAPGDAHPAPAPGTPPRSEQAKFAPQKSYIDAADALKNNRKLQATLEKLNGEIVEISVVDNT